MFATDSNGATGFTTDREGVTYMLSTLYTGDPSSTDPMVTCTLSTLCIEDCGMYWTCRTFVIRGMFIVDGAVVGVD
jgi:hypothetical protein